MFVTAEERARFTPDQLEFLERKRRAAAGLGPIMPQGSLCPACNGRGESRFAIPPAHVVPSAAAQGARGGRALPCANGWAERW